MREAAHIALQTWESCSISLPEFAVSGRWRGLLVSYKIATITGRGFVLQAPVAESSVALPLQQEGSPAMERPPQPRHDVSYTLLIIVVGVAIGILFFTVLR